MTNKLHKIAFFIVLMTGLNCISFAQSHHFQFEIESKTQLDTITQYISIDNIENNTVTAYASEKEWAKFSSWNLPHQIIPDNSKGKVLNMASTVAAMADWDKYPTYEVYEDMMEQFASDYPSICKLEEIGTLSSGRKLLALKISDNVNNDNETEPELLYTGTMHGDETTGLVLLLRLIDYLTSNYGNASFPEVTELVNNTEIWINPAANPDGTYYGGNSSVSGSQRYNAASIDINRNFPGVNGTAHPDGNSSYAEETQLMMDFADNHHFTLAANFHGGAEVVNYPWDTWSHLSADDNWWQLVSREYADYVHEDCSNNGYLSDLENGITNGYAWYQVIGSRQDYMNYFENCREVTIEVSSQKTLSTDQLDAHWTYNRDALIGYLKQGLNGVRGIVTDGHGNPVDAKITIEDHDEDNSWVETDSRAGDYARYLKAGTYTLTFASEGLISQTRTVTVNDNECTTLNVAMGSPEPELALNVDEISERIIMDESKSVDLTLSNIGFADLTYAIEVENASSNNWLVLQASSGVLTPQEEKTLTLTLNASELEEKVYNCNINITGDSTLSIPVSLDVYTRPLLEVSKEAFDTALLCNNSITDSLIILNPGNAELNYTISVKDPQIHSYISLSTDQGVVTPQEKSVVYVKYNPSLAKTGYYSTKILIGGDIPKVIPSTIIIDTIPYFKPIADTISFYCLIGDEDSSIINLKNIGGGVLDYTTEISNLNNDAWLNLSQTSGSIAKGESDNVKLMIDCKNLSSNTYLSQITFHSEYDTLEVPVKLVVDTLPKLQISNKSIVKDVFYGKLVNDTISISNIGGGTIPILDSIKYYGDSKNWITIQNIIDELGPHQNSNIVFSLKSKQLTCDSHKATLIFGSNPEDTVSITLNVIKNPELSINKIAINATTNYQSSYTDTVIVSNSGGGILSYDASLSFENAGTWCTINKNNGEIEAGKNDTLLLSFSSMNIEPGSYSGKLNITTDSEKRIPITFVAKSASKISLSDNNIQFELTEGEEGSETITLSNIGESPLTFEAKVNDDASEWLEITSNTSGTLNNIYDTQEITIKVTANSPKSQDGNIVFTTNVGDTTLNIALNVITTSIDEQTQADINVYPNPFRSDVTIVVNSTDLSSASMEIYNIVGKKVKTIKSFSTGNNTTFKWNGSDFNDNILPKGYYIFKIKTSNRIHSGKIQKN